MLLFHQQKQCNKFFDFNVQITLPFIKYYMKWPYTAIILAILDYANEGSSLPTLLAIGMAYLMVSNYRELRS